MTLLAMYKKSCTFHDDRSHRSVIVKIEIQHNIRFLSSKRLSCVFHNIDICEQSSELINVRVTPASFDGRADKEI